MLAKPLGDQAAVTEDADPKRRVVALGYEINIPLAVVDLEVHCRIALQEGGQKRS